MSILLSGVPAPFLGISRDHPRRSMHSTIYAYLRGSSNMHSTIYAYLRGSSKPGAKNSLNASSPGVSSGCFRAPPGFLYFGWLSGATLKSDFSILIFVDFALRRPRALSGHFPGPPAGDWIGTTCAYLRDSRSMHSTIYAYLHDSRSMLMHFYTDTGA